MKIRDGEEMTLKQRLYMTPLDKFRIFGKFPWPLTISIMLVVLTSLQVLLVVASSTNYSYNQTVMWNNVFLNKDVQGSDTSLTNSYNIFSLTSLHNYIKDAVGKYNHINAYTIANYTYINKENNKPAVRMYINYVNPTEAENRGLKTHYILTPKDLGPFDHYNPKKFIDIVDRFELDYSLRQTLDSQIPTSSSCYNWKIIQTYTYTMHGPITVSLDFDRGVCDSGFFNISMKFYLLTLMIFLLGAAQLSITIISIYQQATVMNRFTVRQTVSAAVWDSLNFDEKVKFIDLWIIFTTIGNISQILGCLNILIVGNVTLSVNETVIGIGCFCSWICIIQFLKPNDHSYTVIDTLSRAYKRLGPYICGVLPIFMGFVFLAMCLFWKTGNYTSVTGAMLVNFAMLNGDTLNGFMSQAISVSGFFGQIYMYAYILFFLCVVQNIFIAIITDGFQSLKIKPISKSGADEDDTNPLDRQTMNISLQKVGSPKDEEKLLSKQRSISAFKKILKQTPEKKKNDKTMEHLKALDANFKSLCKKINHLVLLANPTEPGIDKAKLKERIDLYLDTEMPAIIETYVSL